MKGIFNARPPQPQYTFIWDLQTVLNFIEENWGIIKEIIDKEVSLKWTMLMALTKVSRASKMHHLRIGNIVQLSNQYVSKYSKLHKSWKKGNSSPSCGVPFV